MSIKTTQRITRARAIELLMRDILQLPNDTLADMLDWLADREVSSTLTRFDNFIVSDYPGEPSRFDG